MPSPSSSRAALSRRTALLGAVVAGTAACTPYSLDRDQRPARRASLTPTPPRTDPDVALAATVLAAEQSLLDRIDDAVRAHPRLERVLAATREVHAAHVDLLAEAAPDEPSPSASASPGGDGSPSSAPEQKPSVPDEPARALRVLARHEEELSLADKRSAFAAESGSFARVLGSMAAAAAQQAAVLRDVDLAGRRR